MEDQQRRGIRARLRWTLSSIMIVVAVVALVATLARPFVAQSPPSGEVIGIDFIPQVTRLPGGRTITGLAPQVTVTKKAGGKVPAAKP